MNKREARNNLVAARSLCIHRGNVIRQVDRKR